MFGRGRKRPAIIGLLALAPAWSHAQSSSFAERLVAAGIAQTASRVTYDRYRPPARAEPADLLPPTRRGAAGRGPEVDDMLFAYPITGHYRYRNQSRP